MRITYIKIQQPKKKNNRYIQSEIKIKIIICLNRFFAQEFWEAKAVVTIWQSYNITEAKAILGER